MTEKLEMKRTEAERPSALFFAARKNAHPQGTRQHTKGMMKEDYRLAASLWKESRMALILRWYSLAPWVLSRITSRMMPAFT